VEHEGNSELIRWYFNGEWLSQFRVQIYSCVNFFLVNYWRLVFVFVVVNLQTDKV